MNISINYQCISEAQLVVIMRRDLMGSGSNLRINKKIARIQCQSSSAYNVSLLFLYCPTLKINYNNQGRVRLRARWAIAQGPGCQGAPKREKGEKKAYKIDYQGIRGPQNILAQGPQNILAQGPEDP